MLLLFRVKSGKKNTVKYQDKHLLGHVGSMRHEEPDTYMLTMISKILKHVGYKSILHKLHLTQNIR